MKFKPEKKYIYWGITIFCTAIALMLVYFLFFRLDSIKGGLKTLNKILAPVFYGFILAYLMTPLLNIIEGKWIRKLFDKYNLLSKNNNRNKHIRTLSVGLTIIIVIGVLYLFFSSVIPQVYQSIQNLISSYSSYIDNLIEWVNSLTAENPDIAKFLSQLVYNYSNEAEDFFTGIVLPTIKTYLLPNVNDILSSLSASVMKLVMFFWNIVIGLVISLYVLAGKEKFAQGSTRFCYAVLNTKVANRFIEAIRFTHHTFIGFLGGKVIDSLIIGIICYFSCLILKMPYVVLVSVIVAVTNIIPFFGPYIGAIPSTLIILLVDPKKALYFIIFIIILQQIDGNVIGPKILAQSTGLTSFWIIFSITLFGGLFGIVGMIIGVPITAVIISFVERWTRRNLRKKNLPEESDRYLNVGKITDEGELTEYEYQKPEKKKLDKNSNEYKIMMKIFIFLKKAFMAICDFIILYSQKFYHFMKPLVIKGAKKLWSGIKKLFKALFKKIKSAKAKKTENKAPVPEAKEPIIEEIEENINSTDKEV